MLVRFGEHQQIKANYIFKKINVKKFKVDLTAMHYVGYYTIKKYHMLYSRSQHHVVSN